MTLVVAKFPAVLNVQIPCLMAQAKLDGPLAKHQHRVDGSDLPRFGEKRHQGLSEGGLGIDFVSVLMEHSFPCISPHAAKHFWGGFEPHLPLAERTLCRRVPD